MALGLYHDAECQRPVSDADPFVSKHTNAGEAVTTKIYIANDGKRKGVNTDVPGEINLIYTNLKVQVEGRQIQLEAALSPSTGDNTLTVESTEGLNIGVIMKGGLERMRVEEVVSAKSVRVTRNYTADGGTSTIQSHTIGALFTCETTMVSLALPSPSDTSYQTAGTFMNGGEALVNGVDPSLLQNQIDAQASTTLIRTNNGAKYSANGLIKINNEVMKIVSINGNELTVVRGYNGTNRASHLAQSVIYNCGMVDISPVSHPIFVRVQPTSGLPTQKSRSIYVVVQSDEEVY